MPRLLIATRNPGKMREYAGLLAGAPFELVSLADLGIEYDVDETGETFEENAWLKASEYCALAGLLTLADDSGLEVDALGCEPGVLSARYGAESCNSDSDRVELLLRNLEGVPWEQRTARFRCVIALALPGSTGAGEIPPTPLYERGDQTNRPPDQARSERGDRSSRVQEGAQSPEHGKSPPLQRGVRGDFPPLSPNQTATPTRLASVVGSVAGMIQYSPAGDDGFGYDPVFYLPSYRKTIAQLPLDVKNQISHRADAAAKAVRILSIQLSAIEQKADS